MIGLIQKLAQRPSDRNIRIGKVLFGLLLTITIYYNLIYQNDAIENSFLGINLSTEIQSYLKYSFLSLWIIPMITGIFDINLLKSSHVRYLQIFYSIILFIISSMIVETAHLDSDTILLLLGIIALVFGILGKAITKKWLKTGQKITKIRV